MYVIILVAQRQSDLSIQLSLNVLFGAGVQKHTGNLNAFIAAEQNTLK